MRSRAILRLAPGARWDAEKIPAIQKTQLQENNRLLDDVEARQDPHEFPAVDRPDPLQLESQRRRAKITLTDLQAHGDSDHCPRCSLHKQENTDALASTLLPRHVGAESMMLSLRLVQTRCQMQMQQELEHNAT